MILPAAAATAAAAFLLGMCRPDFAGFVRDDYLIAINELGKYRSLKLPVVLPVRIPQFADYPATHSRRSPRRPRR